MSDFTADTTLGNANRSSFAVIGQFFTGLTNGIMAHRAYMALNAKSDAQLADMGLTRQDVARTAAEPFFK